MKPRHLAWFGVPLLGISVFAADISGTWELRFKADWTSIPGVVCTLAQKGDELTGSCQAVDEPQGPTVDLTAGKVDGDKVNCEWKVVTPGGDAWTYALAGTLDGTRTKIDGVFKLSGRFGGGEGSFTAAKR